MFRSLRVKSLLSSLAVLALSGSILTACSGDDNPPSTTPTTQTGVFLDSPVINIGYRTDTLSGVTNSLGEYKYLAGETVIFFIGELDFPSAPATGTVTPLDLAGTQDTSDPTVVNMIRLLQTLDKDGNLDNGIEIDELGKLNATAVDFSLSESLFETAVQNFTMNAGVVNPIPLVSAADAIAHFDSELDKLSVGESPVRFSESALRNTALYNVYFDDDIGVEEFVVEALSFGGQNNMNIDGEPATFSVTNGILRITFSAIDFDDIKIISFDETLNARATCWEMALNPQFDCASDELEYMFSTLAEAEVYRDGKNGTNSEVSLNFSESALRNATLYNVYFGDSGWITLPLAFDGQNNVVFDDDENSVAFAVINGILILDGGNYIKTLSFDEALNARVTCWDGFLSASFDCVGDDLEYMFSSPSEAEAYRDLRNGASDGVSLDFSESALRNTKLYNVYFDDTVDLAVIEPLFFGAQNDMTFEGDAATFSVTNGILRMTFPENDYFDIKIIAFDEMLNAWATCWVSEVSGQFDCIGDELEYMFSTLTEAQAYRNSLN